ncbi:MAG: glycine cleavage system aminomethyltransferase GcvT [Prevotellaceae bacterium]|jgi:aminomethyltransferase|nr:glycine cleavage system aminomethyltransferase GcvT [Prevotellaceae bacterium]
MKNTAFTEFHLQLGAKMMPFAGFNMPVEYSGINDEHITVREKAGIFDVSHMGEFWVRGDKALDFLQYVTTNDLAALAPGKVQYSCLPNGKGGIVDDLLIYCIDSRTWMLVVNAGNIQKDWDHLCAIAPKFGLTAGEELCDASNETALLAVQGPKAMAIVQKITADAITDLPYYSFNNVKIAGIDNVLLSATGYTGSGGCEIYIPNTQAKKLWNAVIDAGKEFGIKPIGLGARDTLRLEMGFCLYGNDIDDTTSPVEAGLGWIVKFKDSKDFIDKTLLERQVKEGVARKLVSFDMIDRGVPRQHYQICNENGEPTGEVTSGTMSPSRKIGIGMGYVKPEYASPGTEIYIKIREKLLKATVCRRKISD